MEEKIMNSIIIAALITMFASPAVAAEVPKAEKQKTTEVVGTQQGNAPIEEKPVSINKAYYDKAAAEKGTEKTSSGLLYKSLKEGSGDSPGIMSIVKVNYRGTLVNGKEFNSSYKYKKPQEYKMNKVFRCWQEGLVKMKVGGKAKLVCPPELAFKGNGAAGLVPPNAVVTYEIELLGVRPMKP